MKTKIELKFTFEEVKHTLKAKVADIKEAEETNTYSYDLCGKYGSLTFWDDKYEYELVMLLRGGTLIPSHIHIYQDSKLVVDLESADFTCKVTNVAR